jgi:ATP-dependent Clp protease ATP-binding subunit ClpA
MCKVLAIEEYDEDLGARSLITAVKAMVEDVLVGSYLDVNEEIVEGQAMQEYVVDVRNGQVDDESKAARGSSGRWSS